MFLEVVHLNVSSGGGREDVAAGVHGEELLRGAVGDLLGALGVVRLDEVDHLFSAVSAPIFARKYAF